MVELEALVHSTMLAPGSTVAVSSAFGAFGAFGVPFAAASYRLVLIMTSPKLTTLTPNCPSVFKQTYRRNNLSLSSSFPGLSSDSIHSLQAELYSYYIDFEVSHHEILFRCCRRVPA